MRTPIRSAAIASVTAAALVAAAALVPRPGACPAVGLLGAAVAVSAWLGGPGPACFAMALAAAALAASSPSPALDLGGLALGAAAMVLLATARSRAQEDSVRLRGELREAQELAARREVERDGAERKLEATRRDANRRKDEFLGTLAHELRNPLAPMRNALEIMRLAGHDSGAAERARALIERQLEQVVRLIDDLLDVSRLGLGRLELQRSTVDLGRVVASAVERTRPLVEAAGHELTVSLPGAAVHVDGDFSRLVQVLSNLLDNASRFMEAGGRIRLSLRQEEGQAVLQVSDDGIGIPTEMLPHVFSLYAAGSRGAHRTGGGLGMGLTLVRELLALHGGRVEARSAGPGGGSEFVVLLPVVAEPAQPPASRPRSRCGALRTRRRVLVVDDNRDAAGSLATMLRMMGHETLTAHDGASALEVAATRRPQVVLLDIGMPGMSGYEVATRIRGSSWGQGMALVALTGWGQEEDRKRSREAGFDEHLVKPVHPAMLEGVLAAFEVHVSG
jgi:signal transduction histidine kinase/ActR/RegA family two-component response regulator